MILMNVFGVFGGVSGMGAVVVVGKRRRRDVDAFKM